MRLGGGPSILDLFPNKPPRMHWRTYGRLFNKADAEQERWIALERGYLRLHYPRVLPVPKRHTSQPEEFLASSHGARV
jgi:hypothetical protein